MILYSASKLSVYELSVASSQPTFDYLYLNSTAANIDLFAESASGQFLAVSVTNTQIDIFVKVDCDPSCTIGCYQPGYSNCHIPSSCPAGHYLDHTECKVCTSPCKECSGVGDDKCTDCSS